MCILHGVLTVDASWQLRGEPCDDESVCRTLTGWDIPSTPHSSPCNCVGLIAVALPLKGLR
jgi:hypothetical protein